MARTTQRTRIQAFIVTNGDLIRGDDGTVGGAVLMRGGNSTSGNNVGGTLTLQGGVGDGSGAGGVLNLEAGAPGPSGAGASVNVLATSSLAASGVGGSITLTSGDSTGVAVGARTEKRSETKAAPGASPRPRRDAASAATGLDTISR